MFSAMPPTVAYVAEGKLYLVQPGESAKLIDSPFVQDLHDRTARARERNEWKQNSMGWNITGGSRLGLANAAPLETRRVRFSGVTSTNEADLIYTLDTDTVGGVFEYTVADGFERRLYHRNHFRAGDVHRHPVTGRLALSIVADAGLTHLGITEPDGRKLRTITEGDAIDQAPSWAGGVGETIVYQSAGIARNAAGHCVGQSPFALFSLDLGSGENVLLLEDDHHDLLLPRRTADGTLYFLRRPYREVGRPSIWRMLRDMVLFPFRLFLAVIYFLNFFSLMFRQKPLLTSGGPNTEGPDPKILMLYGQVIRADKLLKKGNEAPPLVPTDWHLIRRAADGTETTPATGVAAYDVTSDGGIVYTDGSTIWHRDRDGQSERLTAGRLIERLVVVASRP